MDSDRWHDARFSQRRKVPRLEFDVIRPPKDDIITYKLRHSHRHHHDNHYRQGYGNDYGFDTAYTIDYGEDDPYSARAQIYTHDSSDPWSCGCYPHVSSKLIPSMVYDAVKCPHPEHHCQQIQYFAYPWTVQSHRPTRMPEFGYKQGQIKPPSAATAPPFVYYTSKDDLGRKDTKQPPFSAPVKPVLAPLLSAKPSDRRLRRFDKKKVINTPTLPPLRELEEVTPLDSISQVGLENRFDPDSLRLRTVDEPTRAHVQSDLRRHSMAYSMPNRALSTPRARPLPVDNFPQTPTRIFKGEYVDPHNGKKYEYDIRYGKQALGGTRKLKTV